MKSGKLQNWILTTALVAGVGVCTTTVRADDKDSSRSSSTSPSTTSDGTQKNRGLGGLFHRDSQDTRFAREATEGGEREVQMADLAKSKAQSESVKKYAAKLGEDHRKANQELQQIVQSQNIVLDADKTPKHEEHDMNKFSKLSGEEFDKEFVDHMVKDHQKCIDKFEKQSQKGENQALRDFASKQLPGLRQHLTVAKALQTDRNADISGILNEAAGAQSEPSKLSDPSLNQPQSSDSSKGSQNSADRDSSNSGTATSQDQLKSQNQNEKADQPK
jgi:putative membrane protein